MGVANTDKHLAAFLTSSALANEYSGVDCAYLGAMLIRLQFCQFPDALILESSCAQISAA